MYEDILQAYKNRQEYRKKHTRRNYYRHVKAFLQWIKENKGKKNTEDVQPVDTAEYKAFCMDTYEVNGNVGRLNGLNNFVAKFLGRKELRVVAPDSKATNKQVLSKNELQKYINVTRTPLEKMVVLLQVEGLLRPTEICELKISNIDFVNRKLYLDDTKTGDNYIILGKTLVDAIKEYLKYRVKPKKKEDEDMLIILDRGSHKGFAPATGRSDFVYNLTKRLSIRVGITRSVYPYLIKPSAITNLFNENVNPKIIQRMARHRHIETTLRYDHTNDNIVREFLDKQNHKEEFRENNEIRIQDKALTLVDKLISGDLDNETFKKGLEILKLQNDEKEDLISYV